MKRILMLNYEFPPLGGGASPVSYEIAKRLSETGEHDIDVVTMRYAGLPAYEVINKNMRVHRVRSMRSKKEMCHPWEQLTYLISGYVKCRELIRKARFEKSGMYDICHTHFIIPTGVLALVLKKQYRLPYVITSHGSDVLGYGKRFTLLYPLLKKPWKAIVDGARIVISPSAYLKGYILEVYPGPGKLEPSKVVVIPNGIETAQYLQNNKRNYIFSSGRLLPNKGFQYLIEAVTGLDCGYEVHIAGDGPLRADLEKMARASKTKVILHGWLDNQKQEYRDLLGHAAIFVLASDRENASIVLLEAMSAGCAIITTSGSGTAETVGDAGILVTPRSTSEIRTALEQLFYVDELRRSMQERARERAHTTFDWKKITQSYASVLT